MGISELHVPDKAKIDEFVALAELGRQAQVIFHDLANHFTSLNLTIAELENNLSKEKERFKEYSRRSHETRAQIEYVANLLRSHIRGTHEPFTADVVIREIMNLLADKIHCNSIKVELSLDQGIAFPDGKRDFIHVITNLIGNAIESFEAVTVQQLRLLRVSLTQRGGLVTLSVSDNGCGIEKDNLKNIFEPGFTTKKTGHGIGLTAVQDKIVTVFKGKIRVQSSKAGTCFTIFIPKQNRKRIPLPVLKPSIDVRLKSLESLRNRSTA